MCDGKFLSATPPSKRARSATPPLAANASIQKKIESFFEIMLHNSEDRKINRFKSPESGKKVRSHYRASNKVHNRHWHGQNSRSQARPPTKYSSGNGRYISSSPMSYSSYSTSGYNRNNKGYHRDRTYDKRRRFLRRVARETQSMMPMLMRALPGINPFHSVAVTPYTHEPLTRQTAGFPDLPRTKVRVMNADSFNAAISLYDEGGGKNNKHQSRVAVLNMANEKNPGGGWLNGALAQEEDLCRRSSLSASLQDIYPWPSPLFCLYTPDVVVFRNDMDANFCLSEWVGTSIKKAYEEEKDPTASGTAGEFKFPYFDPNSKSRHCMSRLPRALAVPDKHIVSTISIAAITKPPIVSVEGRDQFKNPSDRQLTMAMMRLAVRAALVHGHDTLVLGALGCGAFKNPKYDIANCWREVLSSDEFRGWFRTIVFAVLDNKGDGNLEPFTEVLHDMTVG